MNRYLIGGIGEILWDVLPDSEELGGAPVNFAYHVNSLGARGVPISTVGDDDRGRLALTRLKNKRVSTAAISVDTLRPTGFVRVGIDETGSAEYEFPEDVAWDHLVINDYGREIGPSLDAVCFGTLAQRTERNFITLHGYLEQVGSRTVKVFDVNLRQNFYSRSVIRKSLECADLLKLNDEELLVLMRLANVDQSPYTFCRSLVKDHNLKMLILTRGREGSVLMNDREHSEFLGNPVRVVDTIGAGDSFTAAVTIGYLEGWDLETINQRANQVASHVCGCKGAMPDIPEKLKILR